MAVNQIFSRKGTNPFSVTSIAFHDLAVWLAKLTQPMVGKAADEHSICFVMIGQKLSFNEYLEHEWDEASKCLRSWLEAIGLDPGQIIADSDNLNFNTHHAKDCSEDSHASHALQLFSIADSEFGICWTWDPSTLSVRGMLWHHGESGQRQAQTILDNLLRLDSAYSHRLSPALLALQLVNSEMHGWIDHEAAIITRLQIQTGHHSYANATGYLANQSDESHDPQSMDLATMTKNICGVAVNITTSALYMQRVVQLADFILEEALEGNESQQTGLTDAVKEQRPQDFGRAIIRQTRSAKRQAEGLRAEAEAWKHKATIVVQTLLSLTTQRDQSISISIAEDSRTLAHKATRDSTSMKAIAAVTVFFLPGTFVSSLFAMPMFDWNGDSRTTLNRHFWIYWAVTLPLTAAVITIWLTWTNKDTIEDFMTVRSRRLKARKEV